jgi:hypothetical protein
VLGPVLYAIYICPLFDLTQITNFADDNFVVRWNSILSKLITNMEKDLEMIIKWLKDSGLMVNGEKTEICLFHRNDQPHISVRVEGISIKSKKSMNVLGVLFDCKLNWNEHVAKAIRKANRSLYAIRMIKRYFNQKELKVLLNSYFYSVLYYNAEIWITQNLNCNSKHMILSASTNAIRMSLKYPSQFISFEKLHQQLKKSTPDQIAQYRMALLLYKVFNNTTMDTDWLQFSDQIITTRRQTMFSIFNSSKHKIGNNILANKFSCLSNKVPLDYLNLNFPAFKFKMRNLFLKLEL